MKTARPATPNRRRKKPFAATLESKRHFEALGYKVGVVEQVIPYTFIKRDFFGFADLIVAKPENGIIAVQVTGGGNLPSRAAKIKAEPRALVWLQSGGKIIIHDWRKRAGEKQRVCIGLEITAADFPVI